MDVRELLTAALLRLPPGELAAEALSGLSDAAVRPTVAHEVADAVRCGRELGHARLAGDLLVEIALREALERGHRLTGSSSAAAAHLWELLGERLMLAGLLIARQVAEREDGDKESDC